MFEKIVYISDHGAHIKVGEDIKTNLLDQHLVLLKEQDK